MPFTTVLSDACTGTPFASFDSRTPDVGAGYTRYVGGIGDGSLQISSTGASARVVGSCIYGPSNVIASDQAIEARVLSNALDDLFLYLRYNGNPTPTAYQIGFASSGISLRIINGGLIGGGLASGSGISANDLVRGEIVGTLLTVYVNGVSRFAYDVAGDSPLLNTGTVAWRLDRTIDEALDDLKVEEFIAGMPVGELTLAGVASALRYQINMPDEL